MRSSYRACATVVALIFALVFAPDGSATSLPGKNLDKKPLLGLAGVIVAAMTAEFNDQLSSLALVDIRGALGISHDAGTWIESVYVSSMVVGMAISPCWAAAVTLRRMVLFAIFLSGLSSMLIPFSPDLAVFLGLRILQGLAHGLTIPLLMTTALRFLTPSIRLYGLACYALTATFFPNLSAALSTLWTDVVDWRFVFLETAPLCTLAGLLVWYGMPQDATNYPRLRKYDWRGTLLVIVGLGSLTTMLEHGNRLDWFNSPLIATLALVSAVAVPLLFVNEWFHDAPLVKPQLFGQRNFAYGVFTLFCFIIISLSASSIPLTYLQDVQGYRLQQAYLVTGEVAALQLVFLPILVKILDVEWVDSRWVNGFGLLCVIGACIGSSFLDASWNRDQFYLWQGISGLGQACIVLSLLMMATNTVAPENGVFASSMVNMPRAVSEALGACVLDLMQRFRGQLHTTRLLEQSGAHRFQVLQGPIVDPRHPPPLLADGAQRVANSLSTFHSSIVAQRTVMVISDDYLLMAGFAAVVFMVLLVLPVRTYPPRIALMKK